MLGLRPAAASAAVVMPVTSEATAKRLSPRAPIAQTLVRPLPFRLSWSRDPLTVQRLRRLACVRRRPLRCLAVAPHLSDTLHTGSSAKAWYLFADPTLVAAFEIVFLNGTQQPTIERTPTPANTLGVSWSAYIDFGVREQNRCAGPNGRAPWTQKGPGSDMGS
ncbi:MAG: hypothetical protein SGJ09_02760 [Phycisphaerae bacterium]|nr:hypothetical protein [Phycisphaerae bacterium]